MANVIEIVLRTVGGDKAGAELRGLTKGLGLLKTTIAGAFAGITLGAIVENMAEANAAAVKLDSVFKNTSRTVGLTRDRLDELASELQNVTTQSDDAVKSAEALLLTFTNVRGQVFERTIKSAADLSAVLGTNLEGAASQLGRALQDPVRGINLLRRAGISFTEEQQVLIKTMAESGQLLKAQEVLLRAIEQRYGGAAAAARNTLGGALTGLKNAFGDLFEGSSASSDQLAGSLNRISDLLNSDDFRNGFNALLSALTSIVEIISKGIGLVGKMAGEIKKLGFNSKDAVGALSTLIPGASGAAPLLSWLADKQRGNSGRKGGRPAGSFQSGSSAMAGLDAPQVESALKEVSISVRRTAEEIPEFLQRMNDNTKTQMERAQTQFAEASAQIKALLDEGIISPETAENRRQEALDTLLPEFDLEKIRALYKPLVEETKKASDFVRGAWEQAGRSIQAALSNMIYEFKFSWKSIVDIVRRAISDILAAVITSGLKKAFASLMTGTKDSSGSEKNGIISAILGALTGLFGKAGGGRMGALDIVGEEGPEVRASPGSRIYNSRQLAFAMAGNGGGGGVNFAPVYQVAITADNSDEREARMIEFFQIQRRKDQEELMRRFHRNGIKLR
jgi:hypothetical protein